MNRLALSLFALVAIASPRAFAQEVPAEVKEAIATADAAIAKIVAVPAGKKTFDNTLGALDKLTAELDAVTSLPIFMQNVSPDAKTRDGARAAEEAVTNWYIELSQRKDLYQAIKAYADSKPSLQGEQKRSLEFTMRDYRRSGIDLPQDQQDRLKRLEMDLSKLGIEFETNIAEDMTRVPLNLSELKGVPADTLSRLTKIGDTYLVGLDGPTYGAIMDYCSVENTRKKMQWMYRRRAPKNIETLNKLLKLRDEHAHLLGYANTVDYEVETRMAKNSKVIKKFYDDLAPVVRKKADQDLVEIQNAKRVATKNPKAILQPWDYAFYKNLLREKKYAVDSQKVSEYFSMERVVDGLFSLTQKLFSIRYKDVTSQAKSLGFPLWHPDVKLYEVYDVASGELLGRLYTDLYPRDNKYSHAACWGLIARRENEDGTTTIPLAALVCNFTKPTAGKPSLLPHDEVETFFHEFGHGLHNLLSRVRYARFAGTSVARDFVEAPSQMLENWVWDPSVLRTFAKHYKTNQPIPEDMLKGMKAAQSLGSGIETQGQMWLGMMDQAFHTAPGGKVDTTKVAWDLYEKLMPYKRMPDAFFQASFGHLNGYQGAYYGYLWSLVYAQDMFGRFEEKGVMSPAAGKYYRDKILARGGSMDEMDMLRDYLGREPKMDAFLKRLGIKQ